MNKFWTVLFHTYWSKLKTKQFLVTSIITAIFLIGVANINQIMDLFGEDEADKIAVLDQTGQVYEPLNQQVEKTSDDIELIPYEKSESKAKQQVQDGDLNGYLLISMDASQMPQATYKADKVAGQGLIAQLKQSLQQVKAAMATQKLDLSGEQIQKVNAPVSFDKVALEEGAKSEKELNQARWIVYGLVILMFMAVMMYGMMIAMEVATEKSSRVMELLVSSVSPVKQMFGKILGVALLGFTQFAFLLVVGFSSFRLFTSESGIGGGMLNYLSFDVFAPSLMAYAVIFFILGFLLYATLLAMIGSLINRLEEAQQMMMPITMLLMVSFYLAIYGSLIAPDTSLITVTSFIPFFSPMIMLLRIGMLSVPFWQIALSLALLVATILLFVMVGARIYRGGVLMYGKASSWKSIKQAFVLTKAEK